MTRYDTLAHLVLAPVLDRQLGDVDVPLAYLLDRARRAHLYGGAGGRIFPVFRKRLKAQSGPLISDYGRGLCESVSACAEFMGT